jgi:hypothetical protein
MRASKCSSTSRSAALPLISMATSSSTSAASSTTACGSARSRQSPTPAESGRRSSTTCGGSLPVQSAGRAAASPTATTGATGLVPGRRARAGRISGKARWRSSRTAPANTIPTISARTISSACAGWSRASRTSPRTSGACQRRTSISGSSTAIARQAAPRSPSCAPPAAIAIRFGSASGESGTNRGAAAATSRPRSTPPNTADSPRGCRATASNWRSSDRGPTAAISAGRGASSRNSPRKGKGRLAACGDGRCTTTRGTRAAARRPTGSRAKGTQ